MIKWITAERTSSTLSSDNVVLQRQLAAYYEACDYVDGKTVLELGCGEGSGTAILASRAGEITAIDYSDKAIKAAANVLDSKDVHFQIKQVPPIDIESDCFDVVVMFQMIEHFADPDPLMKEILRVLKKGGRLLVSTINKEESLSDNPFHPLEYNQVELETALGKHFPHLEFFGLYGDERHGQYLEKNRSRVGKVMKLDLFNISSKLPRRLRQVLYSVANRVMRISLRYSTRDFCDDITHRNFIFKKHDTAGCLDLFVACVK
jgi:ubiquinone/menaquinone biosynthesis C-methylase UbiE